MGSACLLPSLMCMFAAERRARRARHLERAQVAAQGELVLTTGGGGRGGRGGAGAAPRATAACPTCSGGIFREPWRGDGLEQGATAPGRGRRRRSPPPPLAARDDDDGGDADEAARVMRDRRRDRLGRVGCQTPRRRAVCAAVDAADRPRERGRHDGVDGGAHRRRDRLPGSTAACRLPQAEWVGERRDVARRNRRRRAAAAATLRGSKRTDSKRALNALAARARSVCARLAAWDAVTRATLPVTAVWRSRWTQASSDSPPPPRALRRRLRQRRRAELEVVLAGRLGRDSHPADEPLGALGLGRRGA